MERFPEKLREARRRARMSQTALAEAAGVTQRSLTNYERGCAVPRPNVLRKMASTLGVTVEYLTNDGTDDYDAGRLREERVNAVRERFGGQGAQEVSDLMERSVALLAGGTLDQEAKDAFFDALMTAYITCKNEAREKFTPKSARKNRDGE